MNSHDTDNQALARLLHDLNQPLTAINNYAQAGSAMLAAGKADPERLRELFDKISGQCARSVDISRELRQLGNARADLDEGDRP